MSTSNEPLETSKIEFDVNLTCEGCASSVRKALLQFSEINSIDISVEKQSVLVETSLPSATIKNAIEETGKKAVLKGYGSNKLGSAVVEFANASGIMGVVRFNQIQDNLCIIDGTIDGLPSGAHGLHIHEYGDLSDGCLNIGDHFNPLGYKHGGPHSNERHYGDLGNITADSSGRSSFRIRDSVVRVSDIIGRSLAISAQKDDLGTENNKLSKFDGNSGKSLACAIIARSAGLFQNPKRICQCDGISIWDEKKNPSSNL